MDAQNVQADVAVEPPALEALTWLEPVPERYRRKRAWLAALTAAGLAGLLGWIQVRNGVFGQSESIWLLVIMGVGLWRWRYWMALREVRRFSMVTVVLETKERVRRAFPFWLLGFGGIAVILPMQHHFDQLVAHWYAALPFLLIGVIGTFVFMNAKTEKRLSPEAAKIKAHIEAQDAEAARASAPNSADFAAKFESLSASPLVRYPLAAFVLWLAYYVSPERTGRGSWIAALGALGWGLWLARELFGWVLGLAVAGGLIWALFAGVAALPVSVAIVIGALIIASALKR